MEEQFHVYYCSICHICKKPPYSSECMKICSGCKLVQYCSIEHQKKDWQDHKELCKCVQRILRDSKMEHIYQEASLKPPEDIIKWTELKSSVATLIELSLKRTMSTVETQMILFPLVCSYCHLYKVNQLFICDLCKSVVYCCKEHQSKDNKHIFFCKYFYQSFKADMLRLKQPNTMFDFHEWVCKFRVNKFPGNMEKFMKSVTDTLTVKCLCFSEPLSYALTLVYIISKVANVKTNQLTIHVAGADTMDMLGMQTFPLVYNFLPYIIQLNIVLIGPTVMDYDTVPLCIEGSNITLSSVKSLYHEYLDRSGLKTPDIIAVFNCGFCEFERNPEKDLWDKSLSSLLRFNNSVVTVSSFTEKESLADLKRLCSHKHQDSNVSVVMKCQENPFCSLYPHRDWESEGVYFVNNYISVLRT